MIIVSVIVSIIIIAFLWCINSRLLDIKILLIKGGEDIQQQLRCNNKILKEFLSGRFKS